MNPPADHAPRRRRLLLGGAGLAAVAAGAAWQGWRPRADSPAAAGDPVAAAFWALQFDAPSGEPVPASRFRGRPLLLNFWGTWCPPCVKEMPDLDRFAREQPANGWQVLGLAVDNPRAVREFLTRSPVGYTIGLAGFEGSELARKLGNTQSGLPYTVAFNREGAITHRKAGATSLDELRAWAKAG